MTRAVQCALVVGIGASGAAAAQLLRAEGARVAAADRDLNAVPRERLDRMRALGVDLLPIEGDLPTAIDLCVASPGVPVRTGWIAAAIQRAVPVVSELELGRSRFAGRVIAVTGSNGKSTMVKWIAESLRAAGLRAEVAGNYGPPACAVVPTLPADAWLVLEASSFQLETCCMFRADAALLLNLSPNHLDRHATFDAYAAAKARMFAASRAGDACIAHSEWIDWMRERSAGQGTWTSFGTGASAHVRYEEGRVLRGDAVLADLRGTSFANEVLGVNAAGAVAAMTAVRVPAAAMEAAARAFVPLAHRQEPVRVARGVRFVNDSKATTLAAMAAGVRMASGPVRLIAGGLLKEMDLSGVKEVLAQRAAAVYLIGKASETMASAWSDVVLCKSCGTLEAAVRAAWEDAKPGDTVLLSPGCASFDQFRSYEERGARFRSVVNHLVEEKNNGS